jgi:hypothetical protein
MAAGRVALAAPVLHQPVGSRVVLARSPKCLDIFIPPLGRFSGDTLFSGCFGIVWNSFVVVFTVVALACA